ncbi:uncharacterized protein LOC124910633 [Impatiens glandulifera]|uniref:uncharacterized protein LOC124910633 n=1 Tax=Impatiens glandulifera TaxID=253017 RepID=UPI001FB0568A|nr:uncharacterized protein LOC124910633 [Impatiens glandulifera]
MGNCLIRRESAMLWAGEDWGFPSASEEEDELFSCGNGEIMLNSDESREKEKKKVHELFSHSPPATKTKTTEVKIRITKKQLEELLGKVDVQGIPVEQVLEQLMSVSDRFETNQRSWRPALQSIPEINSF